MADTAVEKAHKVLLQVSEDPAARRLAEQRALAAITWKMDVDAFKEEGRAEGRAEGEARGRAEGEARGRAEGEARGRAEGEARGRAEGEAALRTAIVDLCELLGIELTAEQRESLATMTLHELDERRLRIKRERRWTE